MTYKIIVRRDAQSAGAALWEPGCPLQLDVLQVARDTETGAAFLQARFKNVSGGTVNSFSAAFTIVLSDGATESHTISPLDADIPHGSGVKTWDMPPIALRHGDVRSVDVRILSTRSASVSWESSSELGPLPAPPSWNPPLSEEERQDLGELSEVRAKLMSGRAHGAVSREAAPASVADRGAWWICPCGQVNVSSDVCCSCGGSLDELKELDDLAFLREALAIENKRKEEERLEAEREEEVRRKNWRVAKICMAIAAAVFAVIFAYNTVRDISDSKNVWVVESYTSYDDAGDVEWKKVFEHDERGTATAVTTYEGASDRVGTRTDYEANEYGLPSTEWCSYSVGASIMSGMPQRFSAEVINPEDGDYGYEYSVSYYRKGRIKSVSVDAISRDAEPDLHSELGFDKEGYPLYIKSSLGSWFTYEVSFKVLEREDGRVTKMLQENPEDDDVTISYKYDEDGNVSEIYRDGKLDAEITYVKADNPRPWTWAVGNLKGRIDPAGGTTAPTVTYESDSDY